MTDQEDRVRKLAQDVATTYIAPFHDNDERLHRHRVGAVAIFSKLRERQERELAKLIADAIRSALGEAEKETAHLRDALIGDQGRW